MRQRQGEKAEEKKLMEDLNDSGDAEDLDKDDGDDLSPSTG